MDKGIQILLNVVCHQKGKGLMRVVVLKKPLEEMTMIVMKQNFLYELFT